MRMARLLQGSGCLTFDPGRQVMYALTYVIVCLHESMQYMRRKAEADTVFAEHSNDE